MYSYYFPSIKNRIDILYEKALNQQFVSGKWRHNIIFTILDISAR